MAGGSSNCRSEVTETSVVGRIEVKWIKGIKQNSFYTSKFNAYLAVALRRDFARVVSSQIRAKQ
jgi:hypothetical protein